MQRNKTNQHVSFQMISATDGSDVTTGTPSVTVSIDGAAQAAGGGAAPTHKGGGEWQYVPTQAETNSIHTAFKLSISGAISQTVNVYPDVVEERVDVPVSTRSTLVATDIVSDGVAINTALGVVLNVNAVLNATVSSMDANVITAASIAANALDNKGNWNVGKDNYLLDSSQFFNNTGQSAVQPANVLFWQSEDLLTTPMVENDGSGQYRWTTKALEQGPSGGGSGGERGGLFQTNFNYSTDTTASNPGPGDVKFNNVTPSSVTQIYINRTSSDGVDIGGQIDLLANRDLILISQSNDLDKRGCFRIIGDPVNDPSGGSDWFTLFVEPVISGNPIDNSAACYVTLRPSLDAEGAYQAAWLRVDGVETGLTARNAMRGVFASVAGVLQGAAGPTTTIKAFDKTTNRLVAAVDATGRTDVTYTLD